MRLWAFLFLVVLFLFAQGTSSASASDGDSGCFEGMSCRSVTVPLDWSGERKGTLELETRVSEGKGPVLLFLAGGPGQSATPLADYVQAMFQSLAPRYRVAVIDQRGTGGTAVRCRQVQRLYLSDLTLRPRSAVRACGKKLGNRRGFYSTTSTVRDIEAIRKEIGVAKMAVMGTSYGTYVAARYARAYPNRVSRLILDSVVPQENVDPYLRVHMRRAAKVLRRECGKRRCGFRSDPAVDLARLVAMPPHRGKVPGKSLRLRVDGPALLDWLTTVFSMNPSDVPVTARAIHRAARGDYRSLLRIADSARDSMGVQPAGSLSWGLHAATLCSDLRLPYRVGQGTRKSRSVASARSISSTHKRSFWPFDRATALGNGLAQVCQDWPRFKVTPPPKPGRIAQPVLFIAGQYDLSTPVEYARRELRRSPRGRLVVVPRAGHAIALRHQCSAQAVSSFLEGTLNGSPCRAGSR